MTWEMPLHMVNIMYIVNAIPMEIPADALWEFPWVWR